MLLTAVLLFLCTTAKAQFNPGNPAEPQTFYRLTVKAAPAEAATVSGGGSYYKGTTVTVAATATDIKWRFINWTDENGYVESTSSFSYTTGAVHTTLTANYEEVPVSTLALTANYAAGGTLTGAGTYRVGTQVPISASVYSYFTFVAWTNAAGDTVSVERNFTYTTTERDTAFIANYRFTPSNPSEPTPVKAKHRVWFTANPSEAGYFNQTSGNDLIAEGSNYSVTASPYSNWSFINWTDAESGDTLSNTESVTITMGTKDRRLVANYLFTPGGIPEPGSPTTERYSLYGFNHRFYNGQTTLYPLYLENTGQVKALSFSVLVPNALIVGNACTTMRSTGFNVQSSREIYSADTTLVRYTLTGGLIAGHNGKVMEFELSAADTTINDVYRLRFVEGKVTLDSGERQLTFRDGFADVKVDESNLQAAFTSEQYMNRVQFTNQSIHAQSVEWRFGDGAVDTIPNPMHIYAGPGTYQVSLTAYGELTQNTAEKIIVINTPSTWTAEGGFTLDHKRRSVRNFTSLEEFVTLLSQCQITGNIAVAVRNNTNYTLDTTNEDVMNAVVAITTALGSTREMLFTTAQNPDTLFFTTDGSSDARMKTFRLMQRMRGTNVTFFIDGSCVNASLLNDLTSQTVVTRCATTPVPFSDVCDSEHFNISWQKSLASTTVSGYTMSGTGDIPAMTLISTSRTQASVIYAITATLDGSTVYTGTYTFFVNPCQEVDPADRNALTLLYNTLGGTLWTKKWNVEDASIDGNWTGVTFDADGHVTAIALSGNNLAGTLPGEGFTLPYLKTLNFSSNGLAGDIVAFVAGLPQLTTLNLNRNKFTTLGAALPATITSLDLGYQYADFAITDLPSQPLALLLNMQPVIGNLIGYNHVSRDFTAHPQLGIYTESDNNYLGRLDYSDGKYKLSLIGNYRQASGTAVKLTAGSGVAGGSFVRATLMFDAGDANIDGAVDVLDAQHTINYIMGTSQGLFNQTAANTYSDALINVQDVVCTVNLFLDANTGGGSSSVRRTTGSAREGESECVGTVWAEDGYLLLSSQVPVAALDITLQGIRSDQLSLNMSRKHWQLITRDTAEGCRVVLLSPTGNCIDTPTEMGILRISAHGDPDDAVIAIDAADPNARPVCLAAGKATAIQTEAAEQPDNSHAVYDLQGRRISADSGAAGLYIVNGKKTIIK
jgi:PKD repeat protein